MGVELPDEFKKEVTGVGEWQTVSTRVVEEGEGSPGTSLADILKQESVKKERNDGVVKGIHKRFADEDEVALAEDEGRKRKAAWGSRLKTYPRKKEEDDVDQEDLDALLSGVTAKKKQASGTDEDASVNQVSQIEEDDHSELKSADAFLPGVKPEDGDAIESRITAPPVPVFKKRKSKK
jgi:hypothetical protein